VSILLILLNPFVQIETILDSNVSKYCFPAVHSYTLLNGFCVRVLQYSLISQLVTEEGARWMPQQKDEYRNVMLAKVP